MIETDASKTLSAISSAQLIRNLHNTYLIDRANKLPYCKRNILLTKIIFWDAVYTDVIDALLRGIKHPKRKLNVNKGCVKYLKEHKLANTVFTEFFFNFHEPLTQAFLRRLTANLSNGMPYIEKFKYIAKELTELLNIACIELEGLNISCEIFGGEPICKPLGFHDCKNSDNVFFCMMNEEYLMEKGLFEEILEVAMSYLKDASKKVIMIVDYRNISNLKYIFDGNSRKRYDMCMKVVKQVYFYHCNNHVSFTSENSDLCKFIIPDKKSLDKVISTWKNKQEILTF